MGFFSSSSKKKEAAASAADKAAEKSRSGRFAMRCSSRASASERSSKVEPPTEHSMVESSAPAGMGSVGAIKAAAQAKQLRPVRRLSLSGGSTGDLRAAGRPTRFVASSRKLGSGAYGAVLLGTDLCTGEQVAMKLIPDGRMKPASLDREVAMLRRLSEAGHPALLHFHAHVRPAEAKAGEIKAKDSASLSLAKPLGQCHALVMEACRGGELFEHVVKADGLAEDESAPLFAQLVDAVRAAHGLGIAHRDLKLENVLLCGKPGEPDAKQIKLIDWGLAHQHAFAPDGGVVSEMLHSRCGSRSYMAPEVTNRAISSVRGYDGFLADVWSLGVCLFAIHLGFFPFEQADPEADWRARRVVEAQRRGESSMQTIFSFYPHKPLALSPSLLQLLDKMLLFDPSRRISLAEVAQHKWLAPHMPALADVATVDVPAMVARLRDISGDVAPDAPSRTSAGSSGSTEDASRSSNAPSAAALLDPRGDLGRSVTSDILRNASARQLQQLQHAPSAGLSMPAPVERQDSGSTAHSVGSSVGSSVVHSMQRLRALEAQRPRHPTNDGAPLSETTESAEPEKMRYAVAGGAAHAKSDSKRHSGSEQYPGAHSDMRHLSSLLGRSSLSNRGSGL